MALSQSQTLQTSRFRYGDKAWPRWATLEKSRIAKTQANLLHPWAVCQICSLPGVLKTPLSGAQGGCSRSDFQDTFHIPAELLTFTLQPSRPHIWRMFHLGLLGL